MWQGLLPPASAEQGTDREWEGREQRIKNDIYSQVTGEAPGGAVRTAGREAASGGGLGRSVRRPWCTGKGHKETAQRGGLEAGTEGDNMEDGLGPCKHLLRVLQLTRGARQRRGLWRSGAYRPQRGWPPHGSHQKVHLASVATSSEFGGGATHLYFHINLPNSDVLTTNSSSF